MEQTKPPEKPKEKKPRKKREKKEPARFEIKHTPVVIKFD